MIYAYYKFNIIEAGTIVRNLLDNHCYYVVHEINLKVGKIAVLIPVDSSAGPEKRILIDRFESDYVVE